MCLMVRDQVLLGLGLWLWNGFCIAVKLVWLVCLLNIAVNPLPPLHFQPLEMRKLWGTTTPPDLWVYVCVWRVCVWLCVCDCVCGSIQFSVCTLFKLGCICGGLKQGSDVSDPDRPQLNCLLCYYSVAASLYLLFELEEDSGTIGMLIFKHYSTTITTRGPIGCVQVPSNSPTAALGLISMQQW